MILKTLYLNGKIFTGDDAKPFAEAMAVSLGGINAVGTNQEILEGVGLKSVYDEGIKRFEVIDLKGRTVIPGFVDADIRPVVKGGFASLGNELAAKGVVGFAVSGYDFDTEKDMFQEYFAASESFPQHVAIYYPVEYALKNRDFLADKTRMIRDRKIHVSGVDYSGSYEFAEANKKEILDLCRNNFCQLSVNITDKEKGGKLFSLFTGDQNWLEGMGLPNIRIHKGDGEINPFKDIKQDLLNELQKEEYTKNQKEGEKPFIDMGTAVKGYTVYAAYLNGFTGVGAIKAGNRACFIITDRDLGSIPVDDLDLVAPEVTIIDGRIAYKKPGSDFNLMDMKTGGIELTPMTK